MNSAGNPPPFLQRCLIVGCGDVGRRVARRLLADGVAVAGAVRSEGSAASLRELGVDAWVVDLDVSETLAALPIAGASVFYFAPPPTCGERDPRMAAFLAHCERHPPVRIVYISTSGVYGDCGGALVDEERPVAPRTDRARRRLDAEEQLRTFMHDTGVPVMILRVGGIYGPGRLPVERLRRGGFSVICPDEAPYSNRIHSEDLARACIAAATCGRAGGIYNAADGHATSMTDYFYRVADLYGLPRPPCVPLSEAYVLGDAMRSFIDESRRMDVTRLREELGVQLAYPDLEAGLAACRTGGSG